MLPEERKNRRRLRLESLLHEEISTLILEDVKDPECEGVVVTGVRLAKDFSSAQVLVRARSEKMDVTDRAIVALTRATSFIRRELGVRLSLRRVPRLKFIADIGLVHSVRISQILNRLAQEGKISAEEPCSEIDDG